jgi:MOSC domain-containing protein YiiM
MEGKIISLNISRHKGLSKVPVEEVVVKDDYGIEGDVHGGAHKRQVSFLANEAIMELNQKQKDNTKQVKPGDFAENITTEGIDWKNVKVGARVNAGSDVALEVTLIGKECPKPCAIYYKMGDCVMPTQGVFCKVVKGGILRIGDIVRVDHTGK